MKRLLGFIATALILLVAAGIAGHVLIDRSSLRQDIAEQVKAQTGHDLTIGALSVAFFPWPGFIARDVSFAGRPDTHDTPVLTVSEMRGSIDLLPLFHREVRLEHLTLSHGAITLARDEDGSANWDLAPSATSPASATTDETRAPLALHRVNAPWKPTLAGAVLSDIAVNIVDAAHHHGAHLHVDRLGVDGIQGHTPAFSLQGRHGKTPFHLSGHVGPLAAFTDSRIPWAVSLTGDAGADAAGDDHAQAGFDGQILNVPALSGISGSLRLTVGRLKSLEGIFPNAALPDLRGVAGEMSVFNIAATAAGWAAREPGGGVNHVHLSIASVGEAPNTALSGITVSADTLSAPLVITGTVGSGSAAHAIEAHLGTLTQAQSAWQSRLATPLPVLVTVKDMPGGTHASRGMTANGSVGADGASVTVDGALDHVALTGSLLAATSPKEAANPQDIVLDQLALHGVAAFEPASATLALTDLTADVRNARLTGAGAGTDTRGTSETQLQGLHLHGGVRLPLKTGLRGAIAAGSGQIALTAATFSEAGEEFSNVTSTMTLDHGKLTVDPLSAQGPEGPLAGSFTLTTLSEGGWLVDAHLAPVILPAARLAQWTGTPAVVQGPVEIVGDLHGQGADRAALLAALSGHAGASMVGGRIDAAQLKRFVGPEAGMALGHGDIGLRCLGLHMRLEAGVATLDSIGLSAGALTAEGHGTVGLADRALDLHLVPRVGLGGTGASTPVHISGTPDAPHVAQEAGGDGRYQITIGGTAPDPCPAALSAAREGMAGAPPAAPHHSKAADLLHALGGFLH